MQPHLPGEGVIFLQGQQSRPKTRCCQGTLRKSKEDLAAGSRHSTIEESWWFDGVATAMLLTSVCQELAEGFDNCSELRKEGCKQGHRRAITSCCCWVNFLANTSHPPFTLTKSRSFATICLIFMKKKVIVAWTLTSWLHSNLCSAL